MKRPIARPTQTQSETTTPVRIPRAFAPAEAELVETSFEAELEPDLVGPPSRRMGWIGRIAWTAGSILVSAGLGAGGDRRSAISLRAMSGSAGPASACSALLSSPYRARGRETLPCAAAPSMRSRPTRRGRVARMTKLARHVAERLEGIYADRPDMARSHGEVVNNQPPHLFDGTEIVTLRLNAAS